MVISALIREFSALDQRRRRARRNDLLSDNVHGRKRRMNVLYALAMVAVVVGMDLLFFRHQTWFWERLAANIGIVLLFGAFYLRFYGSS
jgi:hypothetical protein